MDIANIDTLRARGTRKWTEYDEDVLPLWIAESDFPTAPPLLAAIKELVNNECFGYSPALRVATLDKATATFYARRYGWRPRPEHIFWVPDVVRGMFLALSNFTRPGSAVAVPVPSYPPLLQLPDAAGREKIECGLDLGSIEAAFAAGAGSILLANPYNPLGTVLDEEFLTGLVELAAAYDARILADEIHAPIVLDGRHIPVASLSEEAATRTITVTATSKAFNIAGLKCGQLIFSNDADAQRYRELSPVLKDGTGTLGIYAAAVAYEQCEDHLEEELKILRANRDFLVRELPRRIPGLKVKSPAATYLLWLDFRETGIGKTEYKDQPAAWLLEHAKVALNEGTSFGTGGAGHARLNFATSREILEEAIDRMARAIEKIS